MSYLHHSSSRRGVDSEASVSALRYVSARLEEDLADVHKQLARRDLECRVLTEELESAKATIATLEQRLASEQAHQPYLTARVLSPPRGLPSSRLMLAHGVVDSPPNHSPMESPRRSPRRGDADLHSAPHEALAMRFLAEQRLQAHILATIDGEARARRALLEHLDMETRVLALHADCVRAAQVGEYRVRVQAQRAADSRVAAGREEAAEQMSLVEAKYRDMLTLLQQHIVFPVAQVALRPPVASAQGRSLRQLEFEVSRRVGEARTFALRTREIWREHMAGRLEALAEYQQRATKLFTASVAATTATHSQRSSTETRLTVSRAVVDADGGVRSPDRRALSPPATPLRRSVGGGPPHAVVLKSPPGAALAGVVAAAAAMALTAHEHIGDIFSRMQRDTLVTGLQDLQVAALRSGWVPRDTVMEPPRATIPVASTAEDYAARITRLAVKTRGGQQAAGFAADTLLDIHRDYVRVALENHKSLLAAATAAVVRVPDPQLPLAVRDPSSSAGRRPTLMGAQEGTLSVLEAQRDQSAALTQWMHTEMQRACGLLKATITRHRGDGQTPATSLSKHEARWAERGAALATPTTAANANNSVALVPPSPGLSVILPEERPGDAFDFRQHCDFMLRSLREHETNVQDARTLLAELQETLAEFVGHIGDCHSSLDEAREARSNETRLHAETLALVTAQIAEERAAARSVIATACRREKAANDVAGFAQQYASMCREASLGVGLLDVPADRWNPLGFDADLVAWEEAAARFPYSKMRGADSRPVPPMAAAAAVERHRGLGSALLYAHANIVSAAMAASREALGGLKATTRGAAAEAALVSLESRRAQEAAAEGLTRSFMHTAVAEMAATQHACLGSALQDSLLAMQRLLLDVRTAKASELAQASRAQELHQTIDTLKIQGTQQRLAVEDRDEQIGASAGKIRDLHRQVWQLNTEMAALQSQVDVRQARIDDLEERLDVMQAAVHAEVECGLEGLQREGRQLDELSAAQDLAVRLVRQKRAASEEQSREWQGQQVALRYLLGAESDVGIMSSVAP